MQTTPGWAWVGSRGVEDAEPSEPALGARPCPDEQPFRAVRAQAQALLPSERIARHCDHLCSDHELDENDFEWQAVDAVMPKVKGNLRPLIRFLHWSGTPSQRQLLRVIQTFSEAFNSGRHRPGHDVEAGLIPERHRRYLFTTGKLHHDRYEFLMYRQLRDRTEAGDVFCAETGRYRTASRTTWSMTRPGPRKTVQGERETARAGVGLWRQYTLYARTEPPNWT